MESRRSNRGRGFRRAAWPGGGGLRGGSRGFWFPGRPLSPFLVVPALPADVPPLQNACSLPRSRSPRGAGKAEVPVVVLWHFWRVPSPGALAAGISSLRVRRKNALDAAGRRSAHARVQPGLRAGCLRLPFPFSAWRRECGGRPALPAPPVDPRCTLSRRCKPPRGTAVRSPRSRPFAAPRSLRRTPPIGRRHSTRPVLKHGPRSPTSVQV